MTKTFKLIGIAGSIALLAACARNEPEPVVIVQPQPIIAKDGTVIQPEPVVVPAEDDGLASGL
ncbi:hypothetical protein AADZ90_005435 [Aestuariibius sp. 2305UL40-4]|uniref:hypothetical protein n=1 Tax=Aestuariibius violaceus TaxID=3234132 RepID=UPI00345EFE75